MVVNFFQYRNYHSVDRIAIRLFPYSSQNTFCILLTKIKNLKYIAHKFFRS
ncbi:MAG: hypothetical protein ETSY2_53070 [Candidatus Entotheonella gemina]|uniref:Uncharacterized protein n=1 Tax=Candidatus Entotheonella gemina TaxID=1429439 RepID=W4L3H7_9BACT|nr:MAG: hypothetical protein ETSY2_53070 [Candidatus Entotheonella gemina]